MDEDIPDDDDQVIEQADPGSGGQGAAIGEGRDREVQQRAAAAGALPRPVIPTKPEREEHELTHVTYAPWCRHCVNARAMNDPHRRTKKHAAGREVLVVSGDCCFMGQPEQEKASPILVVRDHATRKTFAHMVEGKSTLHEEYSQYLRSAVLRDIESLGHGKIVFKTDGEPACNAPQEQIRSSRSAPTVLENSPVDESQ